MGRKKDNKPPRELWVKVGQTSVKHIFSLFLINTKHPDGSPALCTRLKDDQVVDLNGGEEFVTAYLPANMVER